MIPVSYMHIFPEVSYFSPDDGSIRVPKDEALTYLFRDGEEVEALP